MTLEPFTFGRFFLEHSVVLVWRYLRCLNSVSLCLTRCRCDAPLFFRHLHAPQGGLWPRRPPLCPLSPIPLAISKGRVRKGCSAAGKGGREEDIFIWEEPAIWWLGLLLIQLTWVWISAEGDLQLFVTLRTLDVVCIVCHCHLFVQSQYKGHAAHKLCLSCGRTLWTGLGILFMLEILHFPAHSERSDAPGGARPRVSHSDAGQDCQGGRLHGQAVQDIRNSVGRGIDAGRYTYGAWISVLEVLVDLCYGIKIQIPSIELYAKTLVELATSWSFNHYVISSSCPRAQSTVTDCYWQFNSVLPFGLLNIVLLLTTPF